MDKQAKQILSDTFAQMSVEPTILLLGDRFRPENQTSLLSLPWSCIYTTLRQSNLVELFQSKNRRATDVMATADSKTINMNRRELSVVRLSGIEPDMLDIIDQTEIMQIFLERLPQIMYSYGRILLDGLTDPELVRTLYPQLNKIERTKSIFFFGLSIELSQNPYILRLIEKGTAVSISQELSQLAIELTDELNDFDYCENSCSNEEGPTIFIRNAPCKMTSPLDRELLINVQAFAYLLNYEEVELTDTFTQEETVQRFQAFLQSSTTGIPKWYPYREGNAFHMKRYFEESLYNKTIHILQDAASKERTAKPIMLCGQTCCGKTNAICALAYRIFHELNNPVIFIPESSISFRGSVEKNDEGEIEKKNSLAFSALEHLLRQIESKTAAPTPTLIIWDTSCNSRGDINQAAELLLALRSAGRLVQIVCTGYGGMQNLDGSSPYGEYHTINVKISLQQEKDYDEVMLVRELLTKKAGFLAQDADRMMRYYSASDNFIGSLYLFRELHMDLKRRLRRENESHINSTIDDLVTISKDEAKERLNSVMAIQMQKAIEKFGWQISDTAEDEIVKSKMDERREYLKELICCISLCTIYKECLPITVALRLLRYTDTESSKVFRAIMNNPILVHTVSGSDEPLVYIRSELEAKLILEEYGKSRMEVVLCLLEVVSPTGDSSEVTMMQNLIRLIGPNNLCSDLCLWSPDCEEFDTLVKRLKRFREENHSDDLLLPELTLVREICSKGRWLTPEAKRECLREARDLANYVIEKEDTSRLNRYTANLFVEWALLCIRYAEHDAIFSKKEMYKNVSRRLEFVINRFPQDGFAYSAYLWAGIRYAETIDNQDEKMALLQSLSAVRDVLENEVADGNSDINVIGVLDAQMDNIELTDERFNNSILNGKPYGLYFKIRTLLGSGEHKLNFNEPLDNRADPIKQCKRIVELLDNEDYQSIVTHDASCMYTLINAKWLLYSGQPIIPAIENQHIGMSQEQWEEIHSACAQYLDNLCRFRSPRMIYLQALASAHLPQHRVECENLFEELRRSTSYEKRSLHVISDESGQPKLFDGRLNGKYNTYDNKGYIRINGEGFSRPIYFRAEKIGRSANGLRENMPLSDLSVATSFSGFQICKL